MEFSGAIGSIISPTLGTFLYINGGIYLPYLFETVIYLLSLVIIYYFPKIKKIENE